MQLNKEQESKKGYWTDEEPRGLLLKVLEKGEEGSRISLSSEYWYRVQHFDLIDTTPNEAWRMVRSVMKECGRTLVPHMVDIAIDLSQGVDPDAEPDTDRNNQQEQSAEESVVQYYRIAYLNDKQVNQLYYLLKHSLTTEGKAFKIGHTLSFAGEKKPCIPLPPKRRRKRRRGKPTNNTWQSVN